MIRGLYFNVRPIVTPNNPSWEQGHVTCQPTQANLMIERMSSPKKG